LNEVKLSKLLNASEVSLAEIEDVKKITNAEVGFAGPIGLDIPIIMDQDIQYKYNFIVGANKTNYHYQNVNITDFKADIVAERIPNVSQQKTAEATTNNVVIRQIKIFDCVFFI